MIAIAKYPQYPYPYLIIFVNPAKEIVMDTIIIKADTIILFFTGFSTFFKTRIFSKRATNPNVVVTAVGSAHMLTQDIIKALDDVNESNWSKFDENGDPIFNDFGKVLKGPNYREPNLESFV